MQPAERGRAAARGGGFRALRGLDCAAMRRRLRTALPLHRHSLIQLVLDGVLVAGAWWLAYRLRFDQAVGVPERFADLRDTILPWVVVIALVVFTLFRIEQKQWRYVTQRDYVGVAPGGRRR